MTNEYRLVTGRSGRGGYFHKITYDGELVFLCELSPTRKFRGFIGNLKSKHSKKLDRDRKRGRVETVIPNSMIKRAPFTGKTLEEITE